MSGTGRLAGAAATAVTTRGSGAACGAGFGTADGADPKDGFEAPDDHAGSLSCSHGDAPVRRATRNVADRARGLILISSSPARTGFATASKLGAEAGRACSGKWREPAGTSPL